MKQLYCFYFKHILPCIGRQISKDANAYTYLPQSVERFLKPDAFVQLLAGKGLENVSKRQLSFGIASIFEAEKR